jgi:hypothetical protein
MRMKRWLTSAFLAASLIFHTGCVPTSEFNAYKARIKADGERVDAWIAGWDPWLRYVDNNWAAVCPDCPSDPPNPPPPPPPDGGWE